jgi:hypothetical protein
MDRRDGELARLKTLVEGGDGALALAASASVQRKAA